MTVSDETKQAFLNGAHINVVIRFPELEYTIPMSQLYQQSMRLTEALIENDNIEFVGCIFSEFKIQVSALNKNVKGKIIEVRIQADDTDEFPIFYGIVDSAISESNKRYKQIIAYDELYTKGKIDIAEWYNALSFPIPMVDFRKSLCEYIGLQQEETELVNDNLVINKEYEPETLQAIDVLKSICQINGVSGIINRLGKFEYRSLKTVLSYEAAYPSQTLYPPFYPGEMSTGTATLTNIAYYRSVEYEEYIVKPVDKIIIRMSEDDKGASYGTGKNKYIIQGNMFTKGKDKTELATIAENIYNEVKDVSFIPFTAVNNGLPWLECGKDVVSYAMYDFEESNKQGKDIYAIKQFCIFNRTLEGIQTLKDTYYVEGEEYQREFITDLQVQIDSIKETTKESAETAVKEQMGSYTYSKAEIDNLLANLIISVTALPENPDPNKYYAIRE